MRIALVLLSWGIQLVPTHGAAQTPTTPYTPEQCPSCAGWNAERPAFPVFGNTYWVGTRGLGAVLVTSESGHILLDGGLPESAPLILENIRALGFALEDVHAIVNSHAHYDHAGGIAALQEATGAMVYAMPLAAEALRTGVLTEGDPQVESALPYPPVAEVTVIADGDTVRAGGAAVVAHLTPGHAPGDTSWSWVSCEDGLCHSMVYADSQTPVSDNGFLFSEGDRRTRFEAGLDRIAALSCDILMTPHPGASGLWDRFEARERGDAAGLVDPDGCVRYAERYRDALRRRLELEGIE